LGSYSLGFFFNEVNTERIKGEEVVNL